MRILRKSLGMKDEALRILVIGSGGREHTLARVCSQSPMVQKVLVAPGNGGIAKEFQTLSLCLEDNEEIVRLAKTNEIDLVVVGPEIPLCNGVVDALQSAGVLAYGPDEAGARLEGSKAFTKNFLAKYEIPTAGYENFKEIEPALYHLSQCSMPIVIKASGLAAGKGVLICQNQKDAEAAVKDMLSGDSFGESGKEIVIEEFLEGEETSLHLICSGESFLALPMSQDHKKVGEGDTGLNTGGMGAYAPTRLVDDDMLDEYLDCIVRPTLAGLKREGVNFRGTLYIGLMLTDQGAKVLEFNVRFGDPETQVILPLLEEDLVSLLLLSARGEVLPEKISFKKSIAMVVVLASLGYPESYPKGEILSLPNELPKGSEIIHAGTAQNEEGEIISNGGRVLCSLGVAQTLEAARSLAYALCEKIDFQSKYFRRDIGHRELSRQ